MCDELRESEATYVGDLQYVVASFMRPAKAILGAEEFTALFSNLEELLKCNEALLEALGQPGDPLTTLAQGFIAVAPFFKLYKEYCRNY